MQGLGLSAARAMPQLSRDTPTSVTERLKHIGLICLSRKIVTVSLDSGLTTAD